MQDTFSKWPYNGLQIRESKPNNDGFAETRAQLDELAQQAEGSHRQHMGRTE